MILGRLHPGDMYILATILPEDAYVLKMYASEGCTLSKDVYVLRT